MAALDVRGIPKAETFSGKDEDWAEWCFSFQSYWSLVGNAAELDHIRGLVEPPPAGEQVDETRVRSALLYHLLVQLTKGKARKRIMEISRSWASNVVSLERV